MESEVVLRPNSFSESEENLLELIRDGPYINSLPPPAFDDSRNIGNFDFFEIRTGYSLVILLDAYAL